ncbi:MAG: transposase [Acidobacteriota bacterium]
MHRLRNSVNAARVRRCWFCRSWSPSTPLPRRAGPRSGGEGRCSARRLAHGRVPAAGYVLRPPIAQEQVTLTTDGLVAVKLKRPFRDGTVSVEMDPLSLISRLAASVHPPRFHSVRYGGVLAPHSQWRPHIVPSPPSAAVPAPADGAAPG